jgi:hypothetical protein
MRLKCWGVFALLTMIAATALGQQPPKPADLIIGKWIMSDKSGNTELKATLEFGKDTVHTMLSLKPGEKEAPMETSFDAKYKWLDGETIEMTARPPMARDDQTEKIKVKVTEKDLVMTGKDGRVLTFSRVTVK